MPFVTTLRLRSGDRETLDDVVAELKRTAERKGVEFHGPHTSPPETYRVPLYRRLASSGGRYPAWEWTVYERVFDFSGHATRDDLLAYILKVRPKTAFLVHGDPAASGWFVRQLAEKLPGTTAIIPEPGRTYDLQAR